MSKFFVVVLLCCIALAAAAKKQKLRVIVPENDTSESQASFADAVHIEFTGDYSAHGGKKFSAPEELSTVAQSAALQAKPAGRNQPTLGLQAALTAQDGYSRAALGAASTAHVALISKQILVQNLQQQLEDASQQLQTEQLQYKQALQAANAAQNAATHSKQQLSAATAAMSAVQQSVKMAERAAAASAQAVAAQRGIVQDAHQRLNKLDEELRAGLDGLRETQVSAQKAIAAAQLARRNAASSAQLVAANSVAANNVDH